MKLSRPFDSEQLDARQIEEHIERLSIILDRYALSRIEYEIDDARITVEKAAVQQPAQALVVQDLQGIQSSQNTLSTRQDTGSTTNLLSRATDSYANTDNAAHGQEQGSQPAGLSQKTEANTKAAYVIRAPLVGIAYRSKEPGSPPFVEVGDTVEEGTTLCLVEAMKMFNEVKAPISGVISEIHFVDSKLVEHGAPLFSLT